MKQEQRFEYKVQTILENEGFLVFNIRMRKFTKQKFDLVAIRDGTAYLIEVKGKKTAYPKAQRLEQQKLARNCSTDFWLIKQLKGGKIEITAYNFLKRKWTKHVGLLGKIFKGFRK